MSKDFCLEAIEMRKFQTLKQVSPLLCYEYKDARFGDCMEKIYLNFEPTHAEFRLIISEPVHRPVVNFDSRIIYVCNYGKDINLEHGYFFGDIGIMWDEEKKEASLSNGTYEGFVSWKVATNQKLTSPRPDMNEFFNFNLNNSLEQDKSFIAHSIYEDIKDIWFTQPIIILRPNTNLFEGLRKVGLM